jgi:hypothetical protein
VSVRLRSALQKRLSEEGLNRGDEPMKLGSAEPMKLEPSYNQVQEISSNRTIERDLQKRKRNTHHRKLKKQNKKEKKEKRGGDRIRRKIPV